MIPRPGHPRLLKELVPALAWTLGPALCVLLLVLILGAVKDVSLPDLTRDPASVMKAPVYIGVLSNIGILVWCSGAALCFFTFALQRSQGASRGGLVLCSGLLTAVLLLDDFFLLHDTVLPRLGVPEEATYSLYGLAAIAYLARFAKDIAEPQKAFLFLSLAWFALSVALDLVPFHTPAKFFAEDALKFLGIVTWTACLAGVCFRECLLLVRNGSPGGAAPDSPHPSANAT